MRPISRTIISLLSFATLFAFVYTSQPSRIGAQSPQPSAPKYALFEFFKLEQGKGAEHRQVERELWAPVHRERLNRGLIKSWSLWNVRFSGGPNSEYDRVTITTFDKFTDVEGSYPAEVFTKVHPNLKVEELTARTLATRKQARIEMVALVDGTQLNPQPLPPRYAYIGYMRPEPGKGYVNLERQYWKPIHQERVNRGILRSWQLYQVRFPGGSNKEYNYFTVQLYDKFADLETQYPAGIWEKVHPNAKEADVQTQTNAARKMVRTELLNLLESVQ